MVIGAGLLAVTACALPFAEVRVVGRPVAHGATQAMTFKQTVTLVADLWPSSAPYLIGALAVAAVGIVGRIRHSRVVVKVTLLALAAAAVAHLAIMESS